MHDTNTSFSSTADTKHMHANQKTENDKHNRTMPPHLQLPPSLKFGPFTVNPQVFHLSPSKLTYGLVNLKPLLPGHVLICPVRSVPRLSQLSATETSDLFLTVRRISRTIERVYHAESLNVAVQDGVEAGQSVPHVHVHVIPRVKGDMDEHGGSDAIYDLMNGEEGNLGEQFVKFYRRRKEQESSGQGIGGPDVDERRQARGEDEMKREAEWLRSEVENDGELKEDYVIDAEIR